ncbi:MAG: hypothetical protein Q7R95_04025 [bacterium]|nr:hypothetical protein [bacterium]
MNIDEILKQIEENINKPFVTAKFGNNWKEHQKRMLDEGQIDVDMIINIAWIQGRKAILLENELRKLLK